MNVISLAFVLYLVVSVATKPEDSYTDKYDDININEVLTNRRLLVPIIKCTLDQSECSPLGEELKSHIQEALENFCARCTEVQRSAARLVISYLINNEFDYWKKLAAKFDPQNKYMKIYEEEFKLIKA